MSVSKTIILSDGDLQFAALNNVLYNYADVIANRTKKEWYEWDTIYLNLLGELDAYSVSLSIIAKCRLLPFLTHRVCLFFSYLFD